MGGMLAGAELQAAILQRRGQLRPTPSVAPPAPRGAPDNDGDGAGGSEKEGGGSVVGRGLFGVLLALIHI